jgi:hypothetical protein
MTKEEAVERCTKAILRDLSQPEYAWRESVQNKDFAKKLVACLKELGLL